MVNLSHTYTIHHQHGTEPWGGEGGGREEAGGRGVRQGGGEEGGG